MKAVKIKACFDCGPSNLCVRDPMCNGRGYAAYVVPAPLYRQMCGVVKAATRMRYNGYSPRLHIKNVPGSFDLCSKLDKLEQMRRKK